MPRAPAALPSPSAVDADEPGSGVVLTAPLTVNSGAPAASNRLAREAESDADHHLIQRAQRGDSAAFDELVARHERRAHAIAMGLVRDREDASEIVQEAFLRVYRGLDAFNGAASFFTWLYRIVKNLSIDLMRRPAWQRELADPDLDDPERFLEGTIHGADPSDLLHRGELAERIAAAFEALPPYHREVIVMREVEGMSYEEMAVAAGVSKGTIMSRLFHARKKLQRSLAACYREETGQAPRASEDDE
jgi:RNA polymerase sigma-70 factor (ECF subfamily)